MSENSTPEERTEMPTDRRMSRLRAEGQVHYSSDVVMVVSLISGFSVLGLMWQNLVFDMKVVMIRSFMLIGENQQLDFGDIQNGILRVLRLAAPDVLAITVVIALLSALAVMLQTKWNVRDKWIKWKFDLLHPISGLRRIVSLPGLVSTLKSLFKLAIILPIGFLSLRKFAPDMISLMHLSVPEVMMFTGRVMKTLFWKITYVLIAFAIFDYVWGKYQWLRNNKMTKEEVKDESKAVEGDEATRRRIQRKGMQRIYQRIMNSVPQADVVVTNPTHYAVALKYDRNNMSAPVVVAKGRGYLALRIREIAQQSGVPILERKALARALFAACEIGSEIPYELFKAVAEVLAYVYRLKNPHRATAQPVTS